LPGDAAATLPHEAVLHIGTAAVAARVRPLGAGFARLGLATALPLAPGDRAVLRDPGRRAVTAGVEILDVDPPGLSRRGAAADRAHQLAAAPGPPDVHAHVQRRRVVSRAHLLRLGIAADGLGDGAGDGALTRAVGDLLVADDAWQHWVAALRTAVAKWPTRDPLQPSPTAAAARDAVGLPNEPGLLDAVVAAAGLSLHDGRVTYPESRTPAALPAGVYAVVDRLTADPFAAPTREDLDDLRLGRRELAAAAKADTLLVLSGDVVLLPGAPAHAADLLGKLPQPFTASAARQALGSTRRVVLPLLEHLDALGRTERVDPTTRRVLPR
jgi:selenocysteine-specific elongation factor